MVTVSNNIVIHAIGYPSMQAWSLSPAAERGAGTLEHLLPCLGEAEFGHRALYLLTQVLPVASWSVYRLGRARMHMHLSGSLGIPDTTHECWDTYRSGLYRHDSSFQQLQRANTGAGPVLGHWRANDIERPHRARIYDRHGMCERLSLVRFDADGLLAVNLYRHDHQPRIPPSAIRDLQSFGCLFMACIQRHIELAARLGASGTATLPTPNPATLSNDVPALAQRLQQHCPDLTPRERDVCARLARGLTYDGIAVDLGISATTAKTYRNRAFQRLGIRHRNELFRLLLGQPGI